MRTIKESEGAGEHTGFTYRQEETALCCVTQTTQNIEDMIYDDAEDRWFVAKELDKYLLILKQEGVEDECIEMFKQDCERLIRRRFKIN